MPIPFIGGSVSTEPPKERFGRTTTWIQKNGYAVPKAGPDVTLPDVDEAKLVEATLRMTYGDKVGSTARKSETSTGPAQEFGKDNRVLQFKAYLKQTVHESALERFRVRYFNVYFYLEDDTVAIAEPEIENSGMPHGPFLRRMKLDGVHWRNLNVGENLEVYGKVMRLFDCNGSTRKFLQSEGVDVGEAEAPPADPYTVARQAKDHPNIVHDTPSEFDRLKRFLVLDRKVLRFNVTWEDPNSPDRRLKAEVFYFLVDDTVEVREVHGKNDGRDPFPVLLRRQKVPRNHHAVPLDFPSSILETSDAELGEIVSPEDFAISKEVGIFGRKFFVYDMDAFTREFYKENFGVTDFTPADVSEAEEAPAKRDVPPYTGLGSPEDSYLSCIMIDPKAPAGQKSLLQLLKHDNKVLRYVATLDAERFPEDVGRTFVLSLRLADDYVSVFEPPVHNSGIQGGTILSYRLVKRAGCNPDQPEYLGPTDFYVGATIEIFKRVYHISGCDKAVLHWMEENPRLYTPEAVAATRAIFE